MKEFLDINDVTAILIGMLVTTLSTAHIRKLGKSELKTKLIEILESYKQVIAPEEFKATLHKSIENLKRRHKDVSLFVQDSDFEILTAELDKG